MANLDEPILSSNSNPLDKPVMGGQPVVQRPGAESENLKNKRFVQAAMIRSNNNEVDEIVGGYQQIAIDADQRGLNGKQAMREAHNEALEELIRTTEQFATELAVAEPENTGPIVEELNAVEQQLRDDALRSDAAHRMLATQLQDPRKISPEAADLLAVRAALSEHVEELLSDMSIFDWVRDIGLEFMPTKMITDTIQMSDSFNPLEWGPRLERMIEDYQALPAKEQMDRVPILIEDLKEFLPNFKVAEVVTAIIDPASADEFVFWNGPMAVVDAAATAAGMLKIAMRARSAHNLVKQASELGDKGVAARLNNSALIDDTDQVADIIGIERITAHDNATPLNAERYDPAVDPDMAPEAAKSLIDFQNATRGRLGELANASKFIPEGVVNETDIVAAVHRIDTLFFDRVMKHLSEGEQIVDVKSITPEIGARKVTYRFQVRDADGGIRDETFERPFLRDDNGEWESLPEPTFLSKFLLSPQAQAAGGFERVVKGEEAVTSFQETTRAATRLDFADAVVRDELGRLLVEAVKPISGLKLNFIGRSRRIEEVSEILTYGDEIEHTFELSELRSGVLGKKLDDDQIQTYYNIREVMDSIADSRNALTRENMVDRGVKTIFQKGEAVGFGQVIEDVESVSQYLSRTGITKILDTHTGKAINVADQNWDALYANGNKLVRLEDNTMTGNELFQHALVHNKGIRPLPLQVIHYKEGYIPRLNPNAAHFVQVLTDTLLDGTRHVNRKAVRGFDTAKEARAFADEFEIELKAGNTEHSPRGRVVINKEGELEQFTTGSSGVGVSQGLIYGPRKKSGALPFGPPDLELDTPRLGAFEAIGLYLENTKNYMTRNDWRMAVRTRWEKTARKQLADPEITWDNPKNAMENKQLANARAQLEEWMGFSSPSERFFDEMIQRMFEVIIDKGKRGTFTGKVAERVHKLKHRSGVNAIKTGAFHALLGAFNPAQMIVQGSGSAVAFSQGILKSPQTLFRQNGLFMAAFVDPVKHPEAFATVAKTFGWKPATLRKYQELFQKTGLSQSTLVSADIQAAQAGFGTTSAGFRKAMNASTVFFRHGELFNRRVSFMQAIDELGGIEKVSKSLKLQRQMMSRVADMTLNLGKANRAWWQKGIFSIPTQFMQIMTKTSEAYLGLNGAFTPAQRWKLFATQFALYGSTATIGGGWLTQQYLAATGWTRADLSDPKNSWKLAAMNGGAMDFTLQVLLGIDGTMAERTSLINGLDQALKNFMSDESPLWETLGGPAVGVSARVWRRWSEMTPWFARDYPPGHLEQEFTWEKMIKALEWSMDDAGELMGSGLSSVSQLTRYRMMSNLNRLVDSRGAPIVNNKDFNLQTEVAALLGVKPLDVRNEQIMRKVNENLDEFIDDQVQLRWHNYAKYMNKLAAARAEGREVPQEDVQLMLDINKTLDAAIGNGMIRRRVNQRFARRIEQLGAGKGKLERQMDRNLRNYINDLGDEAMSVNERLVPTE